MPVSGGGFEQAYNAQAAVDTNSMLVIAPAVTPACNDRERVKPMLDQLTQLPAALGKIEYLLTDNDFYPKTWKNTLLRLLDGKQIQLSMHWKGNVSFRIRTEHLLQRQVVGLCGTRAIVRMDVLPV